MPGTVCLPRGRQTRRRLRSRQATRHGPRHAHAKAGRNSGLARAMDGVEAHALTIAESSGASPAADGLLHASGAIAVGAGAGSKPPASAALGTLPLAGGLGLRRSLVAGPQIAVRLGHQDSLPGSVPMPFVASP